jgi:HAD superfamily hydrolase (TIGR01549 family)
VGKVAAMSHSAPKDETAKTAILDIDGTLVDTNYHHAVAWYRAFRQHGIIVPTWRIHRHVGMGGDQLIEALAGKKAEDERGDDIRNAEKAVYLTFIEEVEPIEGARELIEDLKERGHSVILASSAKENEVEHYLDLLKVREIVDGWTTSADVEETKPEPDLVKAAIEKGAGDAAVMLGDSTWDCEAAKRAGVATVALLTGGFSEEELRDAGAVEVFDSLVELRRKLDDTPLG